MLAGPLLINASTITSGTIVMHDCGACAYGYTTLSNLTSPDGGYTVSGTVYAEYLVVGSQTSHLSISNYVDDFASGSLTMNGLSYPTVYLQNCCEPAIFTILNISTPTFTYNGAGTYSLPFSLIGTSIEATNSTQWNAQYLLDDNNVQGSGVVTFTLGANPNDNSTATFVFTAPEPGTLLLTLVGLLALLRWRYRAAISV
jgi:hypothetical protein